MLTLIGIYGIQESIQDAEYWIDRCLASKFNHFAARLTKSALRFYQGDRNSFDNLMQSKLKHHPLMRSFSWVFSLPKLPELHFDKYYFFDNIIKKSITSKPFYEFGVWWGSSFKYLIKTFKNMALTLSPVYQKNGMLDLTLKRKALIRVMEMCLK